MIYYLMYRIHINTNLIFHICKYIELIRLYRMVIIYRYFDYVMRKCQTITKIIIEYVSLLIRILTKPLFESLSEMVYDRNSQHKQRKLCKNLEQAYLARPILPRNKYDRQTNSSICHRPNHRFCFNEQSLNRTLADCQTDHYHSF